MAPLFSAILAEGEREKGDNRRRGPFFYTALRDWSKSTMTSSGARYQGPKPANRNHRALVRSRVRVEFGLDEDEKERLLTELTKLHDPINLEDL